MNKNFSFIAKNLSKKYEMGKFDAKKFVNNLIKKNIDYKYALKDVNLLINKGEKVAIIGNNGSGKTTLLKIISRITFPSSGYVGIAGKIGSLLNARTGFHDELNAVENIFLYGSMLGFDQKTIRSRVKKIIKFSELNESEILTPVKKYSTGMIIKLGISVLLNFKLDILLIDEIFANLDKKFKMKTLKKIKEKAEYENITLFCVSHQQNTLIDLCNRGILLNNGIVVKDSELNHVLNSYNKEND
jgi:lipopolysaccharide transport system ATP-binding protein